MLHLSAPIDFIIFLYDREFYHVTAWTRIELGTQSNLSHVAIRKAEKTLRTSFGLPLLNRYATSY